MDGFDAESWLQSIRFSSAAKARRIATEMVAKCQHEGHVRATLQALDRWESQLVHQSFWVGLRAQVEARLAKLTLPPKQEFDPTGWVVLAIAAEGYGAVASCAAAVQADQWEVLRDRILALPDKGISNETIGGRTSDPWGTTHDTIHRVEVITEPSRVAGFVACFPSGRFGVQSIFTHLARLAAE